MTLPLFFKKSGKHYFNISIYNQPLFSTDKNNPYSLHLKNYRLEKNRFLHCHFRDTLLQITWGMGIPPWENCFNCGQRMPDYAGLFLAEPP